MTLPELPVADDSRRFGGVERLYGGPALARLRAAHVAVAGIGGVGSWAVEALVRSGVGRLSLIDLDHVAESNLNRQIHALGSTIGASKVEVMAQRIADISPDCQVRLVDDFLTVENIDDCLGADVDFVVDAIDQPRVKAALIAWCRDHGKALVVCGAAGGRSDPLALRREDLAMTRGDALLASVRSRLRRQHGFTRTAGQSFGVTVICSVQLPLAQPAAVAAAVTGPAAAVAAAADPAPDAADDAMPGSALACAGYGSIVTVTATMGLAAAQVAIDSLVRRR